PPRPHLHLHPFPTRRSSDLSRQPAAALSTPAPREAFAADGACAERPDAGGAGSLLRRRERLRACARLAGERRRSFARQGRGRAEDRKSTRLNSSYVKISYAV